MVPFAVINYAAGASAVRVAPYTWRPWWAFLPGTAAVVILGDAITGNVSPAPAPISLVTARWGSRDWPTRVYKHRKDPATCESRAPRREPGPRYHRVRQNPQTRNRRRGRTGTRRAPTRPEPGNQTSPEPVADAAEPGTRIRSGNRRGRIRRNPWTIRRSRRNQWIGVVRSAGYSSAAAGVVSASSASDSAAGVDTVSVDAASVASSVTSSTDSVATEAGTTAADSVSDRWSTTARLPRRHSRIPLPVGSGFG